MARNLPRLFDMHLVTRPSLLLSALMVLSAVLGGHTPLAANIAPTHRVYISSEELEVTVGADAATIDGKFRFKPVEGDLHESSSAGAGIPVWIPAKATQGDAGLVSLVKDLAPGDMHKLEGPLLKAWNETIGLKFIVGKQEVPVSVLRIFHPTSRFERKDTSKEWYQHEGWILAFAIVYCPPPLMHGSSEVRLRYRQPLRKTRAGAEFLYLPQFFHQPKGATTKDLDRFAMKLQAQQGVSLSMGGVVIPAGHSARLPLIDHQPIKVLVTTP
ncbi:hypothetical protein [Roseimicrobium sp. ORNL1]|uniref:hypothetical protein n=1 Tax=Roseimicrobium sp. ORNL1 TaxID=2711231 RepID=UPI0013E1418F|nr:hypothetical protein [Roseimicrobium sp. ORNL1]QIF03610.1 hypothetical protein G5S37_19475 [Roseimicrobium sp. ORNL1]